MIRKRRRKANRLGKTSLPTRFIDARERQEIAMLDNAPLTVGVDRVGLAVKTSRSHAISLRLPWLESCW